MRTRLAKRLKDRRGFTLIELMMVVAVIVILAAVLIPRIGVARREAKYTGVLQNLNTVQGVLETMIDKNKYQKDDNGDDELAQDLVNELGGIDPGLVNPYSASTTVLGPLAGEGDIADNPAVAVVKGKAGSGDLSDAQGTVVAYIYRDGGRTVAELHPFDGSGNRRDEDGRTVMP